MTRVDTRHRCAESGESGTWEQASATPEAAGSASATPACPRARLSRRTLVLSMLAASAVAMVAVAYGTTRYWRPAVRDLALRLLGDGEAPASAACPLAAQAADDHAGHEQGAACETAANSIELSPQAQRNIVTVAVQYRTFDRTLSVPAIIAGRPGRTEIAVGAPLTGIVTKVHALRGAAVAAGEAMFDLRLTHEDLVTKQGQLLKDLEQLDVVRKEIARLAEVVREGAVAGKTLLERQYEGQKLEASIRADREALLLYGLDEMQVASIVDNRRLLRSLTVCAPQVGCCEHTEQKHDEFFLVTGLTVKPGDHVDAGTSLATVADHCELHIQGRAFEHDAQEITKAAREGGEVVALVDRNGRQQRVGGLRVLYVEDQVERESRALRFYVPLPNEIVRNEKGADGRRFIDWRYRPGQRVELLLPVERWQKCLLVPAGAIVEEGAERYVYQQSGNRFDRKTVHVEHRDAQFAVLAADGELFPGDEVVAQGAYQLHVALKNKSGGGADAHAGHHH